MKRTLTLLALPALFLINCKKTEGNQGLIVADATADTTAVASTDSVDLSKTMEPGRFRYVAFDGTNTNVTFATNPDGNTVTLESHQLTLTVPQVDSKSDTAIYKDHDIVIKAFGDSLTLDQGNNLIQLKKARGQE